MTIEKKTIGTGITAETQTSYSGEALAQGVSELLGGWSERWEKTGSDFGSVTFDWLSLAKAIEANDGLKGERDSWPWFAQQVLRHHGIAEAARIRGDSDTAARFAFELGRICARMQLKAGWEKYALDAKRAQDGLREVSQTSNRERHNARKGVWLRWEVEASLVEQVRPHLSSIRVAELVRERLALSEKPNTIARAIRKVRTAF